MDDLRAIPKISIYGIDPARRVLNGEYAGWWATAGFASMTFRVQATGGGGGGCSTSASSISGAGYTSGGYAGDSTVSAGGSGGRGGRSWSSAHWACYAAYGNAVVNSRDLRAGGSC